MSNPICQTHNITLKGNRFRACIHSGGRVDRPSVDQAEEAVKEHWDYIKQGTTGLKYKAVADRRDKQPSHGNIEQHAETSKEMRAKHHNLITRKTLLC
jgi:hypothetical protein